MRIDKFLKVSRLIKRREVAKQACESGRIKINGKEAKPSSEVNIGDILTINLKGEKSCKILSLKETVKKEESQDLYDWINS